MQSLKQQTVRSGKLWKFHAKARRIQGDLAIGFLLNKVENEIYGHTQMMNHSPL